MKFPALTFIKSNGMPSQESRRITFQASVRGANKHILIWHKDKQQMSLQTGVGAGGRGSWGLTCYMQQYLSMMFKAEQPIIAQV